MYNRCSSRRKRVQKMVAANYFRNKKLALLRTVNRASYTWTKYDRDHKTPRDFNQNYRSTQPARGVTVQREHAGSSATVGHTAKDILEALHQQHPRDFVLFAAKIDAIVQQLLGLSDSHYLKDPRLASLVIKRLHPYDQDGWRAYSENALDIPILLRVTRFLKEQAIKGQRFQRAPSRPQAAVNSHLDEHALRRLAKAQLETLPRLESSAPAYQIVRFADKLKKVVSLLTHKPKLLSDEQMVFKAWNRLNPFYTWRWNLHVAKHRIGAPELSALARFMTDEAARLAQGPPAPKPVENIHARAAPKPKPRASPPADGVGPCLCCRGEHRTARCGVLLGMSVAERLRWARRERACQLCLGRHFGRCRAPRCSAPHCHRPHHAMLHTRSSVLS